MRIGSHWCCLSCSTASNKSSLLVFEVWEFLNIPAFSLAELFLAFFFFNIYLKSILNKIEKELDFRPSVLIKTPELSGHQINWIRSLRSEDFEEQALFLQTGGSTEKSAYFGESGRLLKEKLISCTRESLLWQLCEWIVRSFPWVSWTFLLSAPTELLGLTRLQFNLAQGLPNFANQRPLFFFSSV